MTVSETLLGKESNIQGNLEATSIEEKTSKKEELDSLLKLAEELKGKYETLKNLILKLRAIQILILTLLIVFWLIFLFSSSKIREVNNAISEFNESQLKKQQLIEELSKSDNEISSLERSISNIEDDLLNKETSISLKRNLESYKNYQINLRQIYKRNIDRLEEILRINANIEGNLTTIAKLNIYDVLFSFEIILILTALCLVSLVILELLAVRYDKKLLPEKLALKEVLQLLREIQNIVAEDERWSMMQRAEFRIRLSRFNLEEKSSLNFLS